MSLNTHPAPRIAIEPSRNHSTSGHRSGSPPASAIAQTPGQNSSHQPIGRSNRASSASPRSRGGSRPTNPLCSLSGTISTVMGSMVMGLAYGGDPWRASPFAAIVTAVILPRASLS